ncbi:Nicotine metabolites export pump subunit NepA [Rubrobacter xylanophilus DSM 9941]|uniref:DMT family transporter n=1 Tax=Rubrobacter xylanophilus TaxID=49319 RepID=UPI001C63E153|nr:multidrug efflux SMR transporter [Rubrobacter xylanophilus]QYJ14558.1 Nicotine metabolites export pump subunit NepA [Rubrobacter xylanophilus DSM 9941]
MSWLLLLGAIAAEVAGTFSLKLSEGLSRLGPSLMVAAFYGLSFYLLALVLKRMDVGVAYAVWSGLGTALVAIVGIALFGEELTAVKTLALALIIAGVMLLNLSGAH